MIRSRFRAAGVARMFGLIGNRLKHMPDKD
jgi:hypothetical protein